MSNQIINPYASDAKNVAVRRLSKDKSYLVEDKFPNFASNGSVSGMKKLYYGKGALLVRCGNYIYNVTNEPEIYFDHAIN